MSDVKCPFCKSECREEFDLGMRPYWECKDKLCYAAGPTNDPTGDKFMSLCVDIEAKDKRIAELEEKYIEEMERIRKALCGYNDSALASLAESMSSRLAVLEKKEMEQDVTKRDDRLRVAAMILGGYLSNPYILQLENATSDGSKIEQSIYMADALIAEVDKS